MCKTFSSLWAIIYLTNGYTDFLGIFLDHPYVSEHFFFRKLLHWHKCCITGALGVGMVDEEWNSWEARTVFMGTAFCPPLIHLYAADVSNQAYPRRLISITFVCLSIPSSNL